MFLWSNNGGKLRYLSSFLPLEYQVVKKVAFSAAVASYAIYVYAHAVKSLHLRNAIST